MAGSLLRDRNRRRQLLLGLLLAATVVFALVSPRQVSGDIAPLASEAARNAYLAVRNRAMGPPRVGVQIGHLAAAQHPDELARLRTSTGGSGGGMLEVEVNEAIARALERRLVTLGVEVDLLPATIAPGYRADALVSIHADSSPDPDRRGYKSAVFTPARNVLDGSLRDHLDAAYLNGSGLPDDDANVTSDMFRYYAFNSRYRHSASPATPAVIVELGYLSHPADRELLSRPDDVAALLAAGIIAFLDERGRLGR